MKAAWKKTGFVLVALLILIIDFVSQNRRFDRVNTQLMDLKKELIEVNRAVSAIEQKLTK